MVVNKKMRNKVRSLSFRAAGRGRALAALGRQRRSSNSLWILSQSCQLLLQLSCGPELEDMPQNLRSGERGDATAAYNRGPGVLGSGRGKRQHGLVGATIKARCQLLKKKPTFWAAFAGAHRAEQDACGPMGNVTLDPCTQTLTGAKPRPRFFVTFISDTLSETTAKRSRSLPHCQLTSSAGYTLLLLLIRFPCLFLLFIRRLV